MKNKKKEAYMASKKNSTPRSSGVKRTGATRKKDTKKALKHAQQHGGS